ncbi:hypothetical protein D3C76_1852190 [compost metagenome]
MFEPACRDVMRRQQQLFQTLLDDMVGLAPQRRVAFGQHFQQTLFFYQISARKMAVEFQQ